MARWRGGAYFSGLCPVPNGGARPANRSNRPLAVSAHRQAWSRVPEAVHREPRTGKPDGGAHLAGCAGVAGADGAAGVEASARIVFRFASDAGEQDAKSLQTSVRSRCLAGAWAFLPWADSVIRSGYETVRPAATCDHPARLRGRERVPCHDCDDAQGP